MSVERCPDCEVPFTAIDCAIHRLAPDMIETLRYTLAMIEAIQTKVPGSDTKTRLRFIAEQIKRTQAKLPKEVS